MRNKWKQWLAMFLAVVMIVVLVPEHFIPKADAATPQETKKQLLDDIVVSALSKLGAQYVKGATGDTKYDCFGLVNDVMYEAGFRAIDGVNIKNMYAAQWEAFMKKHSNGSEVTLYNSKYKVNMTFRVVSSFIDLKKITDDLPAGTILLKPDENNNQSNKIGHATFCLGMFNAQSNPQTTADYVKNTLLRRYGEAYKSMFNEELSTRLGKTCTANGNDTQKGHNSTAKGIPVVWDYRQRGAKSTAYGWPGTTEYYSGTGGYFVKGMYNHTNSLW